MIYLHLTPNENHGIKLALGQSMVWGVFSISLQLFPNLKLRFERCDNFLGTVFLTIFREFPFNSMQLK